MDWEAVHSAIDAFKLSGEDISVTQSQDGFHHVAIRSELYQWWSNDAYYKHNGVVMTKVKDVGDMYFEGDLVAVKMKSGYYVLGRSPMPSPADVIAACKTHNSDNIPYWYSDMVKTEPERLLVLIPGEWLQDPNQTKSLTIQGDDSVFHLFDVDDFADIPLRPQFKLYFEKGQIAICDQSINLKFSSSGSQMIVNHHYEDFERWKVYTFNRFQLRQILAHAAYHGLLDIKYLGINTDGAVVPKRPNIKFDFDSKTWKTDSMSFTLEEIQQNKHSQGTDVYVRYVGFDDLIRRILINDFIQLE